MIPSRSVIVSTLLLLSAFQLPKLTVGQGLIESGGCVGCRHSSATRISLSLEKDQDVTFKTPSGKTAIFKKTPGTNGWHGIAERENLNANIIYGRKRRGDATTTFAGSFVVEDEICVLSYINDRHDVACKNISEFPAEQSLNPPSMPTLSVTDDMNDEERAYYNARSKESTNISKSATRSASSLIDVMVVWTKKAECRKSNLPSGCTVTDATADTMKDLAALAIIETNTAYTNSNIDAQVRLAHAYREETYVESAIDTALFDITDINDGKMDDVDTYRTQYGADVVAFIVDTPGCGIGWIGPYKSHMYSVTTWGCAVGGYTFGHEIGHNMGCLHDRGTEDECDTVANPNSPYGYRDPEGAFRTIMAYNCRTGQCDNNPSSSCPRVQAFSNPAVTVNGAPAGNSDNNCALQHDNERTAVENYYPTVPNCSADSECDDNNSCTSDSCNNGLCFFQSSCQTIGTGGCVGSCYINDGIFFDVVAKNENIVIKSLNQLVYNSPSVIEVYTKAGTHVGNTQSSEGWELVATGPVTAGNFDFHNIPPDTFTDIEILAGQRQAFYVRLEGGEVMYVEGAGNTDSVNIENEHMTIYEGYRASAKFTFGYYIRKWRGDLVYEVSDLPATSVPTLALTSQPTISPTSIPTASPINNPTLSPIPDPTTTPTRNPTSSPTSGPTAAPSSKPTSSPTLDTTATPSSNPTSSPSSGPTSSPTSTPNDSPTAHPTSSPSSGATASPTSTPNASPTAHPTSSPISDPTASPISSPTASPMESLTSTPTSNPTTSPTQSPTTSPTAKPTSSRTTNPTTNAKPSSSPTFYPTSSPTVFECEDDFDWVTTHRNKHKGCDWFANMKKNMKKNRCNNKVGEDGTNGNKSCPVSCDTCPKECKNDDDWQAVFKGTLIECGNIATETNANRKQKMCNRKGTDKVRGKIACPIACNTCP